MKQKKPVFHSPLFCLECLFGARQSFTPGEPASPRLARRESILAKFGGERQRGRGRETEGIYAKNRDPRSRRARFLIVIIRNKIGEKVDSHRTEKRQFAREGMKNEA